MTDLEITLDDIRDNFDQRSILRGNEYYLDGRVIELKSYGVDRAKNFEQIEKYDIILTTYHQTNRLDTKERRGDRKIYQR
ncbi:MAG TPA: hypothetical protein EYG67_01680 [Campylobacterales bacterium]|nr:hypothetical protein [Campylobacterales bacterium]